MKTVLILVTSFLTSLVLCAQAKSLQQVCGTSVFSNSGGRIIVNCPPSSSGGCEITLSFLKCLQANDDPAIRVNPSDLVVWYSDQKDDGGKFFKFKLNKFKQEKKGDHAECLDPHFPGDPDPFPNINSEPYRLNHAAYVNAQAKPGTCFRHDITLKDSIGHEKPLDPHVIIGDGTAYFVQEIFEVRLPEKPAQIRKPPSQARANAIKK